MKISKVILSMFLLSVLIISCNDDDDIMEPKGDYENGLLISGEGSGAVSGSVSFVSNDFVTVEHSIYNQVNTGKEFGTYLQSLAFDSDNAYVCVDATNSITAVDRYTFEEVGMVSTGLILPRFMTVVDGIGYATNWGSTSDSTDDFVAIIDLATFAVTGTISVGNGPERIIERNGKLYVSHKGAYSTNNVISVITIATKAVEEITVADRPDELVFDSNGNLWVLCEGQLSWSGSESNGSIAKINITTNLVEESFDMALTDHPELLSVDGTNVYYTLGSNVFSMSISDTDLPAASYLNTEAGFLYGMEVKDGILYSLDASFSGQSTLNVFDVNTKAKINTALAPVGASKIYFN